MEIFGIGILEVILIVLIALIFLGPQDTIKAGRSLGRAVRRFFSSEEWRTLLQASKEIRTIPEKLLEETGLDHPEDILPSEAEIRQEAGLDDLEKNMAEWNADLDTMKKTGEAPAEQPVGQILPPERAAAPSRPTPARTELADLERDLSEWKADLSAWGSSPVIVPTPQAPADSTKTSASTKPAPESQDQPEAETAPQETASSTSPTTPSEQEKT
jgi:Sec-independent protein translocase protein TatA